MARLPAGLIALTPVVLPHIATPGTDFHKPTTDPTVTGCGLDRAELRQEIAVLAIGIGCLPCADCWPPPAAAPPALPPLRPAAPWSCTTPLTVPSRREPAVAHTGLLARIRQHVRRRLLTPAVAGLLEVASKAPVNPPYVPQRPNMKALNRNSVAVGRRGSARTAVGL